LVDQCVPKVHGELGCYSQENSSSAIFVGVTIT
jgi:hypothetical protein